MRIVVDARMYNESGIGRYTRNLLTQLQYLDANNEYFILLLKNDFDSLEFGNFKKVLANFRWYGLSEQIKMPKILHQLKADLVHFPHFNVPIFFKGKFVVTIHDLIHQHFQMRRATTLDPISYKLKQFGYTKIFKNAINKSAKILAPSNYVKQLLIKEWKVEKDKVVVTHEAVDEKIVNLSKKEKVKSKKMLEKFGIQKPYIFYVGNAHPHKNVEGLIRVFGELRDKYHRLQLVLSGSDHYFWQRIKQSSRALHIEDIIYTGQVSDEELVELYKNAQVFVLPSFEEGFGIPILEAMVCGCPVVSSNAGSLIEVGGEAALYFDPGDKGDMADKIDQVLKYGKLREELKAKGKIRVKEFSWEKLAKKTLEVYLQCV